MLEGVLNRIANWAERNSRAVSYASFASALLTGAVYARFITIPEIPYVSKQTLFWANVGWNGVWWGYIHGAIAKRRDAMRAAEESRAIEPPRSRSD